MSIQLYQGSPFIGVGAFQGQISGSTITGAGLPGSLSGSATLVAGGYASGASSTEGNTVTASVGHYLQCSVAFSSSIDSLGQCDVNDWIIYDSANTKWIKLTEEQMIASIVVGDMSQVAGRGGNPDIIDTTIHTGRNALSTFNYRASLGAVEVRDGGTLNVNDGAIAIVRAWPDENG